MRKDLGKALRNKLCIRIHLGKPKKKRKTKALPSPSPALSPRDSPAWDGGIQCPVKTEEDAKKITTVSTKRKLMTPPTTPRANGRPARHRRAPSRLIESQPDFRLKKGKGSSTVERDKDKSGGNGINKPSPRASSPPVSISYTPPSVPVGPRGVPLAACMACRKAKARCSSQRPCRRCTRIGVGCVPEVLAKTKPPSVQLQDMTNTRKRRREGVEGVAPDLVARGEWEMIVSKTTEREETETEWRRHKRKRERLKLRIRELRSRNELLEDRNEALESRVRMLEENRESLELKISAMEEITGKIANRKTCSIGTQTQDDSIGTQTQDESLGTQSGDEIKKPRSKASSEAKQDREPRRASSKKRKEKAKPEIITSEKQTSTKSKSTTQPSSSSSSSSPLLPPPASSSSSLTIASSSKESNGEAALVKAGPVKDENIDNGGNENDNGDNNNCADAAIDKKHLNARMGDGTQDDDAATKKQSAKVDEKDGGDGGDDDDNDDDDDDESDDDDSSIGAYSPPRLRPRNVKVQENKTNSFHRRLRPRANAKDSNKHSKVHFSRPRKRLRSNTYRYRSSSSASLRPCRLPRHSSSSSTSSSKTTKHSTCGRHSSSGRSRSSRRSISSQVRRSSRVSQRANGRVGSRRNTRKTLGANGMATRSKKRTTRLQKRKARVTRERSTNAGCKNEEEDCDSKMENEDAKSTGGRGCDENGVKTECGSEEDEVGEGEERQETFYEEEDEEDAEEAFERLRLEWMDVAQVVKELVRANLKLQRRNSKLSAELEMTQDDLNYALAKNDRCIANEGHKDDTMMVHSVTNGEYGYVASGDPPKDIGVRPMPRKKKVSAVTQRHHTQKSHPTAQDIFSKHQRSGDEKRKGGILAKPRGSAVTKTGGGQGCAKGPSRRVVQKWCNIFNKVNQGQGSTTFAHQVSNLGQALPPMPTVTNTNTKCSAITNATITTNKLRREYGTALALSKSAQNSPSSSSSSLHQQTASKSPASTPTSLSSAYTEPRQQVFGFSRNSNAHGSLNSGLNVGSRGNGNHFPNPKPRPNHDQVQIGMPSVSFELPHHYHKIPGLFNRTTQPQRLPPVSYMISQYAARSAPQVGIDNVGATPAAASSAVAVPTAGSINQTPWNSNGYVPWYPRNSTAQQKKQQQEQTQLRQLRQQQQEKKSLERPQEKAQEQQPVQIRCSRLPTNLLTNPQITYLSSRTSSPWSPSIHQLHFAAAAAAAPGVTGAATQHEKSGFNAAVKSYATNAAVSQDSENSKPLPI